MANNRLQIYCKLCDEMACLAKYYPVDWGGMNAKTYDDFVEKHDKMCWSKGWEKDKHNFQNLGTGEGMYGFRTESDEDGLVSDYRTRPFRVIKKSEYEKELSTPTT